VLSEINRYETRMIAEAIAWRELLAVDTGNFVFFGVVPVVNDPIDPRVFYAVAGLVNFSHNALLLFAADEKIGALMRPTALTSEETAPR
jgi:hypothetical protein